MSSAWHLQSTHKEHLFSIFLCSVSIKPLSLTLQQIVGKVKTALNNAFNSCGDLLKKKRHLFRFEKLPVPETGAHRDPPWTATSKKPCLSEHLAQGSDSSKNAAFDLAGSCHGSTAGLKPTVSQSPLALLTSPDSCCRRPVCLVINAFHLVVENCSKGWHVKFSRLPLFFGILSTSCSSRHIIILLSSIFFYWLASEMRNLRPLHHLFHMFQSIYTSYKNATIFFQ